MKASFVFICWFGFLYSVSCSLQLDPFLVKVDNEFVLKCNHAFCKYINFSYSVKLQNYSILVLQLHSQKRRLNIYILFHLLYGHLVNIF